jgi:hypothetical protein
MRIRLSQDEVYEIKLPDEVGKAEFRGITAKFNQILKTFAKFDIDELEGETNSEGIVIPKEVEQKKRGEYRKRDNEKWKLLRDNREAVVEILKAYYTKNLKEYQEILDKYNLNLDRTTISSNMFKVIRELHKIKPQEVGLKMYPSKHIQAEKVLLQENKK